MRLRLLAVVTALAVPVAASCSTTGSTGGASSQRLTVGAAASLSHVFPQVGAAFEESHPGAAVQLSFAGTDAIVAQIEQGAPIDVFAGASASYGDGLASEGLIDPPAAFCSNSLVLVLPASNPAGITSLSDLTRRGIKLVVGAQTVPIGTYTRKVLAALDGVYGSDYSTKVLHNVVSNEDNVEGVITKVRLGEADAGFVYVTDAGSAGSAVRAIELPPAAQAVAVYPIAVVRATRVAALANEFVAFVLGPAGQRLLRAAGFAPPPSSP
jgi:molybdate transport system substrate-binding protein